MSYTSKKKKRGINVTPTLFDLQLHHESEGYTKEQLQRLERNASASHTESKRQWEERPQVPFQIPKGVEGKNDASALAHASRVKRLKGKKWYMDPQNALMSLINNFEGWRCNVRYSGIIIRESDGLAKGVIPS